MVDLSDAADVSDHTFVEKVLEYSFGVTRSALSWVQTYLGDSFQCVAVGVSTSEGKCLIFGVPRGLVMGPRNYYLISQLIDEMQKLYYCYAEDSQVYV